MMSSNNTQFLGTAKVNAVANDVLAAAQAYHEGGINALSTEELHLQMGDEEWNAGYADIMHLAIAHSTYWREEGTNSKPTNEHDMGGRQVEEAMVKETKSKMTVIMALFIL